MSNNKHVLKKHLVPNRKCDHVHEKRQEMADQIQDITNETQQLKTKIQNMMDGCNNETRIAQVQTLSISSMTFDTSRAAQLLKKDCDLDLSIQSHF